MTTYQTSEPRDYCDLEDLGWEQHYPAGGSIRDRCYTNPRSARRPFVHVSQFEWEGDVYLELEAHGRNANAGSPVAELAEALGAVADHDVEAFTALPWFNKL